MRAICFIILLTFNLLSIGCDSAPTRTPSSIDDEKETKYPNEPVNHLKEEDEIQIV